jgi:hypothetical protein
VKGQVAGRLATMESGAGVASAVLVSVRVEGSAPEERRGPFYDRRAPAMAIVVTGARPA